MKSRSPANRRPAPKSLAEASLQSGARILRDELATQGLSLTHAQCLELVAKTRGARTLHVWRAQQRVTAAARTDASNGIAVNTLVQRLAARAFFVHSGAWAGREGELFDRLRMLLATPLAEVSADLKRAVDALMHDATHGWVRFKDCYDTLPRPADWLQAWEQLCADLAHGLQAELQVQGDRFTDGQEMLYAGRMVDWKQQEGALTSEDPPAVPYEVAVKRSGSQFYVDITPEGLPLDDMAGNPQASLFIEINDGLPCLHLSNDTLGDQALTVFFTQDGLYLRPNDARPFLPANALRAGDLPALQAVEDREAGGGTDTHHCRVFRCPNH